MRRIALAVAALLLLATTAGAATQADPGVAAKTILLGGTVPLTGEAAAFGSVAPGAKAYFDYVNAKGGVNGRKIIYRYYDDGYDPARTVQQMIKPTAVLPQIRPFRLSWLEIRAPFRPIRRWTRQDKTGSCHLTTSVTILPLKSRASGGCRFN